MRKRDRIRKGGKRTFGAVWARGDERSDLFVERFERDFGACVDEEKFVAVGGGDGEEEGEVRGRHGCFHSSCCWIA